MIRKKLVLYGDLTGQQCGDHYHEKSSVLGQGTGKYKGRPCPHQAKPVRRAGIDISSIIVSSL